MIIFLKKLFRKIKYFSGPYKNWETADNKSTGYDSDEIFFKTKKSAEIVQRTQKGYERDSLIYYDEDFDDTFLLNIESYKKQKDKTLNILDFGGSLGSLYFKYKKKLKNNCNWSIIDQKKIVEEGIKNFENKELKFFYSVNDYKNLFKPDIVLISSSLQYLRNYKEVLNDLISLDPKYIIFFKTPFSHKSFDEIYIQKPLKHIYNSTYPSWIFSYDLFINIFEQNFELQKKKLTKPEFFQLSYMNLYFKNKKMI